MFVLVTYQDWLASAQDYSVVANIVSVYKGSSEYARALLADQYFRGENPTVHNKCIVSLEALHDANGRAMPTDVTLIGNRISSNFFFRFVTQQNQFLLGNGLLLADPNQKKTLGFKFDTVLQQIGERALIQGVAYGFWNFDHLELISAVKNSLSGFVPLLDEQSGALMAGVQYWQLDEKKPIYYKVFLPDGWMLYRSNNTTQGELVTEKTPYVLTVRTDGFGVSETVGANYSRVPLVPLYANPDGVSELSDNIQSKIDLYDKITSDFGDNLERTNDIYWVVNNFAGTRGDLVEMLAELRRLKIAYTEDTASGSTITPQTIEVPYLARSTALSLLEKALYQDYMALDMRELTGGSLTNVAIQAATSNLRLKADRYEWQVFDFCQQLLRLCNINTEVINFKRQSIGNKTEVITDIYMMRQDITRKKALELNEYISSDEIPQLLIDREKEDLAEPLVPVQEPTDGSVE